MIKMKSNRKGFTLLELMIVIIIIGILIAIAVPRYIDARNRAEAAQPLTMLASIRSSTWRYITEEGSFPSGTDDLDLGMPTDPNWKYEILETNATNNDFTVTATKNGTPNNGETVQMDQDGGLAGTHPGI